MSSGSSIIYKAPTCIVCGDEGIKEQTCQRCSCAYYCSPECRRTDQAHSLACNAENPQPRIGMIRVAFFAIDRISPVFLDLPASDGKIPKKAIENLIGLGIKYGILEITHNPVRNRILADPIRCYYTLPSNASECNQSAEKLINFSHLWDGPDAKDNSKLWVGNMLFVKFSGTNYRMSMNMNAQDFRDVVDYLSVYKNGEDEDEDGEGIWRKRAEKVKGVGVRCHGNTILGFRVVKYPQDHPLIRSTRGVQVTNHQNSTLLDFLIMNSIGIPLIADEQFGDPEFEKKCDTDFSYISPEHHALYQIITSRGWKPLKRFEINFLRQDRKDLDVEQVEGICKFIMQDIGLAANTYRQKVTANATRKKFVEFWKSSNIPLNFEDPEKSPGPEGDENEVRNGGKRPKFQSALKTLGTWGMKKGSRETLQDS